MAAKKGKAKGAKRSKQAIWDKKNPKSSSKTSTPSQKAEATKRAKADGRSKPSLVDNINAQKSSKKKKKKKSGGKQAGSKQKRGKKSRKKQG